jgi:hypothetical protein
MLSINLNFGIPKIIIKLLFYSVVSTILARISSD